MCTWKVYSLSGSNRSYMTRILIHYEILNTYTLASGTTRKDSETERLGFSQTESDSEGASKANSVTFSSFAIYSYTPFNHFSRTNNTDTDTPSSLTTRARSLERERERKRERDFSVELQRRNVHFALAQYDDTITPFSRPSPFRIRHRRRFPLF